jgi:hypothetical protein
VPLPLTPGDLADIRQTLALFAHVCDNRQEDALGLVFTEDVVFTFARSGRVLTGLGEVLAFLRHLPPEAADHHTTDTVIMVGADGTVRALSRYLAVLPDGSVTNGEYEDVLVLVGDGWRIRSRRSIHRHPRADGEVPSRRNPAWLPATDRVPPLGV